MKKENLIFNYAQALALYGKQKKVLAKLSQDYERLKKLIWDNLDLRVYFLFPGLKMSQKKELLLKIKDGIKLEEGFFRFLCLLLDEERFNLFSQIYERFLRLVFFYTRKAEVTVTAAFALSKEDEQAIVKVLEKILKKEVVVKTRTDKALLGGMSIYSATEGLTIDYSLKRRMEQLKHYIEQ
jgi:F-type H+-transporting ATPase subunit delta